MVKSNIYQSLHMQIIHLLIEFKQFFFSVYNKKISYRYAGYISMQRGTTLLEKNTFMLQNTRYYQHLFADQNNRKYLPATPWNVTIFFFGMNRTRVGNARQQKASVRLLIKIFYGRVFFLNIQPTYLGVTHFFPGNHLLVTYGRKNGLVTTSDQEHILAPLTYHYRSIARPLNHRTPFHRCRNAMLLLFRTRLTHLEKSHIRLKKVALHFKYTKGDREVRNFTLYENPKK